MTDFAENYREMFRQASERMAEGAPDSDVESDLEWAAVSALCSIADSLSAMRVTQEENTEISRKLLAQMERANVAPESEECPAEYVDSAGVVWERGLPAGAGGRFMYRLAGVSDNAIYRADWYTLEYLKSLT